MSGSTRAGILRLASAILSFGVSRGHRIESPVQYLASQQRPEPKPSTRARALSDEACSSLIAATRPGLKDFVSLLAFTGVRLPEDWGCDGATSTSTVGRRPARPRSTAVEGGMRGASARWRAS